MEFACNEERALGQEGVTLHDLGDVVGAPMIMMYGPPADDTCKRPVPGENSIAGSAA